MSYYGNINISEKHGMEKEYEEININNSDGNTGREYMDMQRYRTSQNTGTEAHFIVSLGLNKSWFAQYTKLLKSVTTNQRWYDHKLRSKSWENNAEIMSAPHTHTQHTFANVTSQPVHYQNIIYLKKHKKVTLLILNSL